MLARSHPREFNLIRTNIKTAHFPVDVIKTCCDQSPETFSLSLPLRTLREVSVATSALISSCAPISDVDWDMLTRHFLI